MFLTYETFTIFLLWALLADSFYDFLSQDYSSVEMRLVLFVVGLLFLGDVAAALCNVRQRKRFYVLSFCFYFFLSAFGKEDAL